MNRLTFPFFLILLLVGTVFSQEVIEEIYAVVNDEIITYSDLQKAEKSLWAMLQANQKEADIEKSFREMKENLLNHLIEQKLILSKARSKKYDVDSEVDMIIQEIMKDNNIASLEELRSALQTEGIDYRQWKEQLGIQRMQQHLLYEEITAKIKVDNSEIMEYYRANQERFTKPAEFTLNCILLKTEGRDSDELSEMTAEIDTQLSLHDFISVAENFSELQGEENSYFLGRFKKGEMQDAMEKEAVGLPVNGISDWIKTNEAWYLLQLVEFKEASLIEYRDVRDEITAIITSAREEVKLKEYLETLKNESYINVLKNYE